MNPAALEHWAKDLVQSVNEDNGAEPGDVVDFKLADEPVWYFPQMLNAVKKNPQWLAGFRTFLASGDFEHGGNIEGNTRAVRFRM